MKPRAPVDLHLAGLQQIAPAAQTVDRDPMRGGVMGGGQSTPIQRFDVHRPERLDRRRALRHAQPGCATPPFRLPLVMQGLGVADRSNPASECARVETMLNAIFCAAKAAPTPRLDVDRPPCPPSLVLKMFRRHRRSSNARRNPKWTANAPPIRCARTGRLLRSCLSSSNATHPKIGLRIIQTSISRRL